MTIFCRPYSFATAVMLKVHRRTRMWNNMADEDERLPAAFAAEKSVIAFSITEKANGSRKE